MSKYNFLFAVLITLTWKVIKIESEQNYLKDNYEASVIEDAYLDAGQLIEKYKYPLETHFVPTEDGYILRMHRMPKAGGRPVLLMHGLMDSSATWILLGPQKSLGYYLYDLGYDVWMGNVRGNRYSRNHTKLNPDLDKEFWSFSWHEIGMYDLPALIDYVLLSSGSTKLGYFGHSQGTTTFWVLTSMRPEYNEKITMMHGIAPVAFAKNTKTIYLKLADNFIKFSGNLGEFLPHSDLGLKTCFRSKISEDACVDILWQIIGKDTKGIDKKLLPIYAGHMPAGCNFKQWVHYVQLSKSDRFCQFDYGTKENIRRYGKQQPPSYPLKKITVPVGLYYSYNDYLSSEVDVQRLAQELPNVVEDNLIPYKKWNHMTMIWGIDARELLHKRMIEIMHKYE